MPGLTHVALNVLFCFSCYYGRTAVWLHAPNNTAWSMDDSSSSLQRFSSCICVLCIVCVMCALCVLCVWWIEQVINHWQHLRNQASSPPQHTHTHTHTHTQKYITSPHLISLPPPLPTDMQGCAAAQTLRSTSMMQGTLL